MQNFARIQLKKATTELWNRSIEPIPAGPWSGYILLQGEPALEETKYGHFLLKYGDGVTPWESLPYYADAGLFAVLTHQDHFVPDYITDGTSYGVVVKNDDTSVVVVTVESEPDVGNKFETTETINVTVGAETSITDFTSDSDYYVRPNAEWNGIFTLMMDDMFHLNDSAVTTGEMQLIGEIRIIDEATRQIMGSALVVERDDDDEFLRVIPTQYASAFDVLNGNKW